MKKFITMITGIVTLIRCATPYQPRGWAGGYEDMETQPGIHYVVFYGNGFTDRTVIIKYWHTRASEICGGPGNYKILEKKAKTKTESVNAFATTNIRPTYGGGYRAETEYDNDQVTRTFMEGYIRCTS